MLSHSKVQCEKALKGNGLTNKFQKSPFILILHANMKDSCSNTIHPYNTLFSVLFQFNPIMDCLNQSINFLLVYLHFA